MDSPNVNGLIFQGDGVLREESSDWSLREVSKALEVCAPLGPY